MKISAKIISAAEAAALVPDGATIAFSGFGGCSIPEELTLALGKRFEREGRPRSLTLVHAAGQGDGHNRGFNHLAVEGMVKRVVGGYWNLAPKLGKLALDNKIEAYNFPQGVICHLFRDIAAGKPGTLTHVGLGTFVDPRQKGGKLNERTTEDLVELVELGGREWLLYKAFPIHVAFLRGTASDAFGNISFEEEAITGEGLSIAQAVKNSGGKVVVQVARLVEDVPRDPKSVRIPGIFVDAVVLAHEGNHPQTFAEQFNSSYITSMDIATLALPALQDGPGRYVGARAFAECRDGDIVNLGIGMPEGVAVIAKEQGRLDQFTLTVEAGSIGGIPAGGLSFGASAYPMAIIDQPYIFDFFDGGGLDVAILGMAECDARGNVNVSKFGGRVAGVGGFMNISQNAKKVVFAGTFTAGGLKTSFTDGQLQIDVEGKTRKFVRDVEHLTFSGREAWRKGQPVLYVTERAVFRLIASGLELTEIAPGINVQRDILARMDFVPAISGALRVTPARVFAKPNPAREAEISSTSFS